MKEAVEIFIVFLVLCGAFGFVGAFIFCVFVLSVLAITALLFG